MEAVIRHFKNQEKLQEKKGEIISEQQFNCKQCGEQFSGKKYQEEHNIIIHDPPKEDYSGEKEEKVIDKFLQLGNKVTHKVLQLGNEITNLGSDVKKSQDLKEKSLKRSQDLEEKLSIIISQLGGDMRKSQDLNFNRVLYQDSMG